MWNGPKPLGAHPLRRMKVVCVSSSGLPAHSPLWLIQLLVFLSPSTGFWEVAGRKDRLVTWDRGGGQPGECRSTKWRLSRLRCDSMVNGTRASEGGGCRSSPRKGNVLCARSCHHRFF